MTEQHHERRNLTNMMLTNILTKTPHLGTRDHESIQLTRVEFQCLRITLLLAPSRTTVEVRIMNLSLTKSQVLIIPEIVNFGKRIRRPPKMSKAMHLL